ncbi:MAG: sigma-70 family RNA polymerase sigma factor [Acidobacteria bacterium]|nr:sigma-70 family RNA polymerase sigma factor [Acidobacteriota bacterium]
MGSRAKTNSPDKALQLPGSKERPAAPQKSFSEAIEREVVALYTDYAAPLHRYGAALTSDSHLVQEAIQETFLSYFAERLAHKEISDSRAWLFRALRTYLQESREQAQGSATSAETLDNVPDRRQNPETDLRQKEILTRASSALSPREFECVCLRAEGLSYQEIADVMQIRCGTVGVLLGRGLKKLRRVF